MTDLSSYSTAQLRELHSRIDEQVKTRQGEEVNKVRTQILELASSVGMSLDQLFSKKSSAAAKSPKKVAPQYQNPENAQQQWSGRGRQPGWVKQHMEKSGNTLDIRRIV